MHLNALSPTATPVVNVCCDVGSEKLNLICRELSRPGAVAEWEIENRTPAITRTLAEIRALGLERGIEDLRVVVEPTGIYHRLLLRIAAKLGFQTALVDAGHVTKMRAVVFGEDGKTDQRDPYAIEAVAARGRLIADRRLPEVYQLLRQWGKLYADAEGTLIEAKSRVHRALTLLFPDFAFSTDFLYGPSGNGKTSVAERMLRVYQDAILIPYSVEVDGQIIAVFDPVVHQKLELDDPEVDPRWILCRRPCIVVGGELIPSMLELRIDDSSGIYAAPLQMKANNGIFIIDDFGRQLMSPRDLLNRWIVPLDRRVDYLSLRYGVKFQIPFEVMVVFSTNLDPQDLADEAFLRRIHNKILIESIDAGTFDQIFARVVSSKRVPHEPDSAEYLRRLCLSDGRSELRACYPLDICNILASISDYERRPINMGRDNLERAVNLYFARSQEFAVGT